MGDGKESEKEPQPLMRAAIFQGPKDIRVGERPDPVIEEPTDAVVRVVLACVCGSDLWYYRGASDHPVGSIGHEFIGVVEDVGGDVTGIARGDLVVAPFIYSDMSCPHCRHGSTLSCAAGGTFARARGVPGRARRHSGRGRDCGCAAHGPRRRVHHRE